MTASHAKTQNSSNSALQAQVDAQLLEHGAFSPLELLFNAGRLDYGDYERWRRGGVATLDEVLMGSLGKIKDELDGAASYARGIGLLEEPHVFDAWSDPVCAGANRTLRSSADPELRKLMDCRYIPAQKMPQLDLFFDNPVVALTSGIVRALSARNAAQAQRQLDRLYAQTPNHADLAAFDRLVEALAHLDRSVENIDEELAFLTEVSPLAKRLLGTQARDLLAPLWRQLAQALEGMAFRTERPNVHRSFALAQAQDWADVAEAVRREPDWQTHSPLCLLLAHSGFHRQHRVDALTGWFQLCWRAPDAAVAGFDTPRQPDGTMTAAWRRFVDGDVEAVMTAQDFPAWMLLNEPGLAQLLPVDLPTGHTAGGSHYRCVHRWIHARRAGRREEEIAQRKALLVSHPSLFQWLKRSV